MKKHVNDLFKHRHRSFIDADKIHKNKTTQTARAAAQNWELCNNTDTHEKDQFRELSSSSQDARDSLVDVSMRIKQTNRKANHHVLFHDVRKKHSSTRRRTLWL